MKFSESGRNILDVVIIITLVVAVFTLPLFYIPENGTLVTAATAIFAVVAGFFIADATANYLALQKLIANENATLISLVEDLEDRKILPEITKSVRGAVDAYLIAQLDFPNLDHTDATKKEFDALLESLHAYIGGLGDEHEALSDNLQKIRGELVCINQEISLTAHVNLSSTHWILLLTLASMVGMTVLSLRNESYLMNILAIGMLLGTHGVLIVLRDVDNNRFLQKKLSFKNPQQVFRSLKLPPYYPPSASRRFRTPDSRGRYRTRNSKGKIVTLS